MTSYLRTLRSITPAEVDASNRIGRGVYLSYQGNKSGTLTLKHTDQPLSAENCLFIQTNIGAIGIEKNQAELFLNSLSSAPCVLTFPITPTEEQTWYAQMYNQCLFSTFQHLFGCIEISTTALPIEGTSYELTWKQSEHSNSAILLISANTLEALLERQHWQPCSFLDLSNIMVNQTLCIARTHMSIADLNELGIGDVLIPDSPLFTIDGQGILQIANLILQLDFVDNGTLHTYQVTHLNKVRLDEANMYDEHADTHGLGAVQEFNLENPAVAMPDVQVSLSLQAGEISLSLREISQLHIGSVLVASGEAPGYATLLKGKTTVARGELVEVDGRLGVQITQVFLHQCVPTEGEG